MNTRCVHIAVATIMQNLAIIARQFTNHLCYEIQNNQISLEVLYGPANDPAPQMIPVPQIIPKLDRR